MVDFIAWRLSCQRKKKMLRKFLFLVERTAAKLLGKGWGSSTVEKEFKSAVSLLSNHTPKLCIDIGGNKGIYTQQILNKFPSCAIVVFEPADSNVKLLNKRFKNYKNVNVEQVAVSNEIGESTLYSNEDGSGLASLTKRRLDHFGIEFENTESIKTVRFENYWKTKLNSEKIDVCKIDIEGHELDALAGFGDALNHISVIQFEFGGCNIDTRTFFQDFWYFFQEKGFDLYRISPIGLIHIPKYRELDEVFKTTNYLAKRKS
jgi:FkbM family methyltransferase